MVRMHLVCAVVLWALFGLLVECGGKLGDGLCASSFAKSDLLSGEARQAKIRLKPGNRKEGSIVWLPQYLTSASRRRYGFVDRPELLHSDRCAEQNEANDNAMVKER